MATRFKRAANSILRAEKEFNEMKKQLAGHKSAAEHYANLWTDSQIELHRANVRIKRLEQELREKK
jgi:hypothetical protein